MTKIDYGRFGTANWIVGFLIAASGCALYLPFISNQLLFDDQSFFYSGLKYSYYAITPFDFAPRTFPFFTFALVQTLTQSFETQRVANLAIHCTNAYLLFVFSRELQTALNHYNFKPQPPKQLEATILSAGISLLFLLHPVAVYGAGYLAQRTILFATLFSLGAQIWLLDALQTLRWRPLFFAALAACMSIYSKEHAIALPFTGIVLLFTVTKRPSNHQVKMVMGYLLICIPTLVWMIYRMKYVLGETYEPFISNFIDTQIENAWPKSLLTECELYFQYLRLWLIPDTARMSIDLRATFPEDYLSLRPLLSGLAFLGSSVLGAILIYRVECFRIAGYGIIYSQLLFLTELATIRIQEPFVLYRSYLWAPGFLMITINCLALIPQRARILAMLIAMGVLAYQSVDRLQSMESSLNAWQDAKLKLQGKHLPGSFRIFYNLGIQKIHIKQFRAAWDDFATCQKLSPRFSGCYSGKAVVLLKERNYELALNEITSALELAPKNPSLIELQGKILEAMGEKELAKAAYSKAESYGLTYGSLFRKGMASPQ